MRSAGVILKNAPITKVTEWLNQFGVRAYPENKWGYPSKQEPEEVVFYMRLYNTLSDDFELDDDDMEELNKILGEEASVWISVQVPGYFDGRAEVRLFATTILKEFEGIAFDDDTKHWWTLTDIENDLVFEGKHFFSRR